MPHARAGTPMTMTTTAQLAGPDAATMRTMRMTMTGLVPGEETTTIMTMMRTARGGADTGMRRMMVSTNGPPNA